MKKGMVVTLNDGVKFNLVDSVNYNGSKYFAATSGEKEDDNLYFFKLNIKDGKESLEYLDYDEGEKIINALIQHMENAFE